jgi:hypothetical protein
VWRNDILVSPDDLITFAWSAPMRDLAAELDLSDVGLRKLLARCGVSPPPQGYWNKLRAGKPVPIRPKAPSRRPGGTGRLSVDARFAKMLSPAAPLSSDGPFASAVVPESLDELYTQELKAIGSASVPKALDRPHKGLLQLLKKEQRRREKAAESAWFSEQPKFDTPLGKRRIRILNAIFLALGRRGHDGDAYEHDGDIHARAIVGNTYLGLDLAIAGKHRTVRQYGYLRPAPDLPASTPLVLRLNLNFNGKATVSWQDDDSGTLETKVAQITAGIIVEGEKKFRRSLREAEERIRQEQIEQGKRRQERLAQLNQKRLQDLRMSGDLLRQAHDIRALVDQVRHAIDEGSLEIDASTLQAWQQWALGEADRIDPVRSGQIFTHLQEPSV